ncbi:MAG TPA: DUF433 domain-containing protein [Sphingomonas sp.]|uniref:DUF433 domain-containing protein n=1 Tax=Sphingomonas sp. TaxID=28214 RepID=UPI002ED79D42
MNIFSPVRDPGPVRVVSTPGILGGMPCVSGTRVPAEVIRVSLNAGESKFEIFCAYPYLPMGSVEAVIRWAQESGLDVKIPD